MNWKWLSTVGLFATACFLLNFSGCAHDQQLVSMTIQPSTFTFGLPDPTAVTQFTAIGTYIHPPASKDITNIVTWKSSTTLVATVTAAGVVSPAGTGCGSSAISASTSKDAGPGGNTVFASANVTVNDPGVAGCPMGGTTVTLSVDVVGNGTVVSSPTGINCTNSFCSFAFPQGTAVTLAETPGSGATFAAWQGCTASSATQCTLVVNTSTTVTATFN